MKRGVLIGLSVVLLGVTIPCCGIVVMGWMWLSANSKTVNGQNYLFIVVASDDEVLQHPFWKKTLTPAELDKMVATVTMGGYPSPVFIDDECRFVSGSSGGDGSSQRVIRVPRNKFWDRPRAVGQIKAKLDEFVKKEQASE